jgi:Ca-activated chloride channel homolog
MRQLRNFLMTSFFLALCAIPILPGISYASERTIIVLDASGSMWGQINGRTKIEIARETLSTVLKSVPTGTELGLMVYGHREKGSCSDIELAVPPQANSADAIMSFAEKINPKGKTPLSEAVKQAADALKYTEEKATVVLVTDGLETCEADPCALASELEKKGVDFTAHVVGFGLSKKDGKEVACLAENTGGKYFEASDADQLVAALKATVLEPPKEEPKPAPPPEPAKPEFNVMTDAVMFEGGPSLDKDAGIRWDIYKAGADGKPEGNGVEGGYGTAIGFNLEPGHYVAVAGLGRLSVEIVFDATANETAKPIANFNAGTLVITPKRTATDAEPDANARVDAESSGISDGGYGKTTVILPAGSVTAIGTIGRVKTQVKTKLAAGETRSIVIIIGTGVVVTKAVYADGGPAVEGGEMRFDVVDTKRDINGNRNAYDGTYGVDNNINTPVGDLVLVGKLGSASGETPFSVAAGERKEVTINLKAGVLAVSAPGAYRVDVKSAKKDIQGNQKDISGGYDPNFKDTLPEGDYIIHVTYEGDKAPVDKPASIKAGERTEVTVE